MGEIKSYPIDRTRISNRRKICGAFVWYRGMLRTITSQNVGAEHVIIANLFRVKRVNINLARVGDLVAFHPIAVKNLPDSCKSVDFTYITEFRGNGHVVLDYDGDTTHYSHLIKYKSECQ